MLIFVQLALQDEPRRSRRVLGPSAAENLPKPDLQIIIKNFRFPGVWHPREAAPRSSWGVAPPEGRGCDVPGKPGRATGGFLAAHGVLGLAAGCPAERGTAQRGKRGCGIKAAGLYKFHER